MIRFYDAAIELEQKGSAVLFKEPLLLGQMLFSIADVVHGDRRRLYVCEANDEEHGNNLAIAQVREIEEEAAIKLAAEYHPECHLPRTDPETGAVETLHIPACDLMSLLGGGGGAIGGELLRDGSA